MAGPERSIAFDTIAAEYDATRGGLVRGASFARSFAAHLARGGTILEVGIGTAAVALPLSELTCRAVVGIDLSLPMLERGAERLPGRVAQADAYRLPFADGPFEEVVLAWVLQLVPDPAGVLRECRRVVRASGRVLVIVAQPESLGDADADLHAAEATLLQAPGFPAREDRRAAAADAAAAAGFRVEVARTEAQTFTQAPTAVADVWQRRLHGWMVDLDDATFAAWVQPAIDALLALPEPDRPRERTHAHPLLVLERSP
jgi:SAM-dependent methyltransferase